MSAPVKLAELTDAYDWVIATGPFENEAYVNRDSGKIYWASSTHELDEELPEDIEDGTLYIAVPHMNDLNLGRNLALRFVEEQLPASYELVNGYFHKKGAYARFKDLLERTGRLEAWYQYEATAVEHRPSLTDVQASARRWRCVFRLLLRRPRKVGSISKCSMICGRPNSGAVTYGSKSSPLELLDAQPGIRPDARKAPRAGQLGC